MLINKFSVNEGKYGDLMHRPFEMRQLKYLGQRRNSPVWPPLFSSPGERRRKTGGMPP